MIKLRYFPLSNCLHRCLTFSLSRSLTLCLPLSLSFSPSPSSSSSFSLPPLSLSTFHSMSLSLSLYLLTHSSSPSLCSFTKLLSHDIKAQAALNTRNTSQQPSPPPLPLPLSLSLSLTNTCLYLEDALKVFSRICISKQLRQQNAQKKRSVRREETGSQGCTRRGGG